MSLSSKLEPAIRSHETGHIGIHGGVDGHTVTKPLFLAQIGYHISLPMVLCYKVLIIIIKVTYDGPGECSPGLLGTILTDVLV